MEEQKFSCELLMPIKQIELKIFQPAYLIKTTGSGEVSLLISTSQPASQPASFGFGKQVSRSWKQFEEVEKRKLSFDEMFLALSLAQNSEVLNKQAAEFHVEQQEAKFD